MQKSTGLTRVIKATGYSLQGLRAAWLNEAAFRQEVLLFIVATILAIWLDVTIVERLLLISSVALIVIVELLNSAIEAIVDRIGTEHNELSGRAKDIGSAAVFTSIVLALFVWCSILFIA